MFFILALGLGTPLVFLAVFSGSLDRLPRSGAWMVWVRTIFGFVLLAMAVYFLRPLFPHALAYHLALALILFIGGIYLAWIEPTRIAGKAFPLVRQAVGLAFFCAALILAIRGVEGYVGQRLEDVSAREGLESRGAGIAWEDYAEERVAKAKEQSRPVMIDFWAEWCLPCKELDRVTFPQPEVVEASRGFLMLKVDLTSARNPEAVRLKKKFEVRGVPTLVFLRPDGAEARELRLVGFVRKEKLLERMGAVAKASL
jgi:thiol:disulfide interchange protein DsbD